jgi:hypothetical protein
MNNPPIERWMTFGVVSCLSTDRVRVAPEGPFDAAGRRSHIYFVRSTFDAPLLDQLLLLLLVQERLAVCAGNLPEYREFPAGRPTGSPTKP